MNQIPPHRDHRRLLRPLHRLPDRRRPRRPGRIYHYPALAVTAQGCLAITDPQQTRDFFTQGRAFYHSRGIRRVRARDITTDAEVPGVWVGRLVLQNYDADDQPVDAERNAYQVVTGRDGRRRIAVTTPLDAYAEAGPTA
jgi:hypothetical protein